MLASATVSGLESLYDDPTCHLSVKRNLLVISWHDAPTAPQLREMVRLAKIVGKKYPAGTAMLDLIVEGTPKFSDEVHKEASRLAKDVDFVPCGAADCILIPGFAGVATRSFLNTIYLVSRSPRPTKAFPDIATGAAWLAPRVSVGGEKWTADEIAKLGHAHLAPHRKPGSTL